MPFRPSIQKVWRKKIAAQTELVIKAQAVLAVALKGYTAAATVLNKIQSVTRKLAATLVIPADPGIRAKYHNLTDNAAMGAINNGLTGAEFDLLPPAMIKAAENIYRVNEGMMEAMGNMDDADFSLRNARHACDKAEQGLRHLTQGLESYVASKDAQKALGNEHYNAWKKQQKQFLASF